MEYNHRDIEARWQKYWRDNNTYRVDIDTKRPKYYVLDMFPYPSGAGLHVGHPLGYIASDIVSRYKRLKGFNVLHPMGYDAYGLPAEQYAIQTGQHPEVTTQTNIARYREQLDKIGFCYDWSREIRTCDPEYYKWTQWTFKRMFLSYYDTQACKAMPITELVARFEKEGANADTPAASSQVLTFSADEWKSMDAKQQSDVLMNYRIAYLGNTMVNWCPKLGTVLANDEVSEGVSLRGGYPVEQKVMYQWCLRVSAYAERLLKGLDTIDWTDSLKETQRNWIGRSEGAEMHFSIDGREDIDLEIFTTRADTVFGVTFMVLAPESEYVDKVTTAEQREAVTSYIAATKRRTERERLMDKHVSGVFTGAYAVNPLTGKKIPIWVSDYVLAGYGTGAIKEGIMMNSEGPELNLNGLTVKEAIAATKKFIKEKGIGRVKVNYRLRDAIFSRQRYWGEPFPVYYKEGIPCMLDDKDLPLLLPEIDAYLPTEKGEPPLGRAKNWKTADGYPLELNTMPGFAGSSAYYLRYMDPRNHDALVSKEADEYWRNVDLYIGGTEHATGHLIYSRFWNKFLYDLGIVVEEEPFKKLINQGMIQGRSNFVYRIKDTNTFVSAGKKKDYDVTPIHVDVNIVKEAFRKWRPEYNDAQFVLEDDGRYICGYAVEKMSKSMFNVVNPDDIVATYGADTLRLYEMFLGPLEQSKPWDTNGIDGVNRFLKKLWALFYKGEEFLPDDSAASEEDLRSLHRLIAKVTADIDNFSFNTSVAAFMICVNELTSHRCRSRQVLQSLLVLLTPFAPHIAEELWHALGNTTTICDAQWPQAEERYLKADTQTYAVSFNGKARFTITVAAGTERADVERLALSNSAATKWLEGKQIVKIIVVPGKIVNVVVK